MNNVIDFPIKHKKVKGVESFEREMLTLQTALNRRFKNINKAQEEILKNENEINKLQDTYDKILLQYAEKVGSENVEMRFIDYSTKVKFSIENGKVEINVE